MTVKGGVSSNQNVYPCFSLSCFSSEFRLLLWWPLLVCISPLNPVKLKPPTELSRFDLFLPQPYRTVPSSPAEHRITPRHVLDAVRSRFSNAPRRAKTRRNAPSTTTTSSHSKELHYLHNATTASLPSTPIPASSATPTSSNRMPARAGGSAVTSRPLRSSLKSSIRSSAKRCSSSHCSVPPAASSGIISKYSMRGRHSLQAGPLPAAARTAGSGAPKAPLTSASLVGTIATKTTGLQRPRTDDEVYATSPMSPRAVPHQISFVRGTQYYSLMQVLKSRRKVIVYVLSISTDHMFVREFCTTKQLHQVCGCLSATAWPLPRVDMFTSAFCSLNNSIRTYSVTGRFLRRRGQSDMGSYYSNGRYLWC